MIYQHLRISCEPAHGTPNVLVNLHHLLNAGGLLQCHCNALLKCVNGESTSKEVSSQVSVNAHPRTSKGEVTRFSTASTVPSGVTTPMAVEPSCG